MIVRTGVACDTCGCEHTARIGMGNDRIQLHKFPCKKCKETICVGLEVDFANVRYKVLYNENARATNSEGAIINLDARFPIPAADMHRDRIFPRLYQGQKIVEKQIKGLNKLYGSTPIHPSSIASLTPANMHDEWLLLKTAWSLSRNGKLKLSKQKISRASKDIYTSHPLDGLDDWMWRFCSKLGGNAYEEKFRKSILPIYTVYQEKKDLKPLLKYFKNKLYNDHQSIFFDIIKQYFDNYHAFSQVHLYCSSGIPLPKGHIAASNDFDNTKMFYGNAFEAFTTLVELLACFNNVIQGRKYDAFENMTLAQYKKIDKAGRCSPFSANKEFFILCDAVNNQIRNASHHGRFKLSSDHQTIAYRTGKGGTSKIKKISYTKYLVMCEKLFMSICVLLRIELILISHIKNNS